MRECYRFFDIRLLRLPSELDSRARAAWTKSLAGFMLHRIGLSGTVSIPTLAAPPDFALKKRGRPPLKPIKLKKPRTILQ
jgi:hypothetical protein